MKYLKIYENFDSQSKVQDIKRLISKYHIELFSLYKINDDLTVNIEGDVHLYDKGLIEIPFKFNKVIGYNGTIGFRESHTGFFSCKNNYLNTLENSPNYIEGWFDCSNNNLTTLIGGPKHVGEAYYCVGNNLKDVYGFPEIHSGDLIIQGNPICDITDNAPQELKARFAKLLNEYKVIRNQDTVIESRLMDALSELGITKLEYEITDYKLI